MDVTAIFVALFMGGAAVAIITALRDRKKNANLADNIVIVGADKAVDTMRDALDVANRQRDDAVAEADRLRIRDREREREVEQLRTQLSDLRHKLDEAYRALNAATTQLESLQASIAQESGEHS